MFQPFRVYKSNPDGITWRVKKILEKALAPVKDDEAPELLELSHDMISKKGNEYLEGLQASEKTERMSKIFDLYMENTSINQIVKLTGICKGSVSGYLKEIELDCNCRIIRGKNVVRSKAVLQKKREHGTRMASVLDFHSFRVTWVTLALNAGVPLELVQKVTGHKTVEIVLKHYFQPGREDFRNALQSAMPPMLMEQSVEYKMREGPRELMDNAVELLKGMNSKNWRERKKTTLKALATLDNWYISNIITEKNGRSL